LNLGHVLTQIDLYERATMLFVVLALIALPFIGRWLTERDVDEEAHGRTIAMFLTGLTAVGVVVVLVAAALGPHPSV
jgi:hypothetical protein